MPNFPFRAFTLKHNGRLVNRIVIDIGLSLPFDPAHGSPPGLTILPVKALWDTGATGSVVTPATIAALGLISTGTAQTSTANGVRLASTYLVNLYLPQKVAFPGLLVTDCSDTQGFGAIIGMDVMSQGDSTISNHKGETWLSFRVPSSGGVDYVVESNRAAYAGAGRNDPCPCGQIDPNSGRPKKYKKCHGATH